jgi:electron transfer flavoprotein beta subunit
VISVEGATAHLRRAGLGALRAGLGALRAGSGEITIVQPSPGTPCEEAVVRPYRPRARALAAPQGEHPLDRLRALTDTGVAGPAHGETSVLEPAAAATRIVAALTDWGYLPRLPAE